MKPAHKGEAMLVPATNTCAPLFALAITLSATIATSGMFRWLAEPILVDISMLCCQTGMGHAGLIPPLLEFHVVSESQPLAGPRVERVVPPTLVTYGLSAGSGMDP